MNDGTLALNKIINIHANVGIFSQNYTIICSVLFIDLYFILKSTIFCMNP